MLNVLFSLGEAIAALSLTLLIPQFLKPIYEFRLRVFRFRILYLYSSVFSGVLFVVAAALVREFAGINQSLGFLPFYLELLGTALFAIPLVVLAIVSIVESRVTRRNVERFVVSAANLLAEADERTYVDFANELVPNLTDLIKMWEPYRLTRFDEPSAFYEFIFRREIRNASFISNLFMVLADERFCIVLVTKCSWIAVSIIERIPNHRYRSESLAVFVQEIAHQSVVHPESMMGREIDFKGFSAAPLLSTALFGHAKVSRNLDIFSDIRLYDLDTHSASILAKFSKATIMLFEAALSEKLFWDCFHLNSVESAYQSVFIRFGDYEKMDTGSAAQLHDIAFGLSTIIRSARETLQTMPAGERRHYYEVDGKSAQHIFGIVARLAAEALIMPSRYFDGPNGRFWHYYLDVFGAVFPRFGHADPIGMDPIQLSVARTLIDKVEDNLNGFYPPVTKALLGLIGPYRASFDNQAFTILADNFYSRITGIGDIELKRGGNTSRLFAAKCPV